MARVLPQIYTLNRERIQEHIMALACILPRCETNDKLALLQLFTMVAGDSAMVSQKIRHVHYDARYELL